MRTVCIATVEDDESHRAIILDYLHRLGEEDGLELKITSFEDGEDLLEGYRPQWDIILLDIRLRFTDGMTVAHKIREMDEAVTLIFLTSMAGHAIEGYEVDAADYILKPVSYDMFARKLRRAIERKVPKEESWVVLPFRDGVVKLKVSDIYYIESQSHQMRYQTRQGEFLIRGRMDDLEKELSQQGFFRSNRGYLVNLNHVSAVRGDCCVVDGCQLPVSRKKKAEFLKRLTGVM